ncbi:MAG: ROK family glucokinase [Clostridia bacterium]
MIYAGIDIGGMSIKIGLVNEDGKLLISKSILTESEKGYAIMTTNMANLIDELLQELNLSRNNLSGIGIGVPGTVDSKLQIVNSAANIGWRKLRIVDEFKKHFSCNIQVNNDANCACLGEYVFGGGKQYQNIVFVTLGTGVGGGIIIDGKLFEGYCSAGAEVGHLLLQIDGYPCACGRHGCWEQYASATALIRQTKAMMQANPLSKMHQIALKNEGVVDGQTAFRAADLGDEAGAEVVKNYIRFIAEGLISLCNLFHPQVFILGGGICNEKDKLTVPLQKHIDDYIKISGFDPAIKVTTAELGNKAGIIGASCLVMDKNA